METYQEMKTRQGKEIDSFEGLFFAFNKEQLEEGLLKVNATTKDIVSIGAGGFILRLEVKALKDMFTRHSAERKDRLKEEKKLVEALVYELNNHEYSYTYDTTDALASLGLTSESIEPKILNKACKLALV